MSSYTQILDQVQSLSRPEQLKLLAALSHLLNQPVEVQDDGELIPLAEIRQSQAAWDDYRSGSDRGITSQDLKRKLSGRNLA